MRFNNQLNDRYQAKLNEYRGLARGCAGAHDQFGIGLALNPIPQAQTPVLSAVAGLFAETIYYVQVDVGFGDGARGIAECGDGFRGSAGEHG